MYRNSQRRFKMKAKTKAQYGAVYDSLRQPVGRIMNGRILDAHGSDAGHVISSHLYDAEGIRVGQITNDSFTLDSNEQEIGQVTLTFQDRILGGAVALLLFFKIENGQFITMSLKGTASPLGI